MTAYIATTPGIFPLPDWAKTELSALKGHQKHDLIGGDESDAITGVYATAREEVVDIQSDAGLDLVVEGQLRWDDMLAHPLCVHKNVETRGLLRYYDNNNFYREPVVTGELTPSGDIAGELESASDHTGALQAVLPGPFSLFDLATDEYYGDDESFLSAIGEFLAGELEQCPATEAVFLLEPSLVTNPPDDSLTETVIAALDTIADVVDSDVIVHTYWGSLSGSLYEALLASEVDGVGLDLVTASDASLLEEYGAPSVVALGVVDGQNTLVESAETIQSRVEWFEGVVETVPDRVYVVSNTELFYLPVSKFEEKLAALGRAMKSEVVA